MRRIRPAVLWLQEYIGLPQALASQRLQTDGAEVLWDFGRRSGDLADQDMVDGPEDVAGDYGLTVAEIEEIRLAA